MLPTERETDIFFKIEINYFIKNFPRTAVYIFSLNLQIYILFFKKSLENINLYSNFSGKVNFQVCGNPAL